MDMVDCPVKTCRKHGTGGKVLDVHSYPMDKVDSPMWTQYFDGKLGHVCKSALIACTHVGLGHPAGNTSSVPLMLAWLQAFVSCCGDCVQTELLGYWTVLDKGHVMALARKALPPLCWHPWPGYTSKRGNEQDGVEPIGSIACYSHIVCDWRPQNFSSVGTCGLPVHAAN